MKFQRDISMLKTDIKLNNFLTKLNDRKNVWWQLADRKRSSETFYDFFTNNPEQYFYEYSKYDNNQSKYVNYQSEYQRFRNDWSKASRFSQYIESQRYDQIYDDYKDYQLRFFFSNNLNYSNDSDKTSSTSFSLYSSSKISNQNDINRIQRLLLNTNQNVNDYTSRFDSLKNISFKSDFTSSIRFSLTSKFTQFPSRSNKFDRRNDEYKSKIYNMNMRNSEFDEENSREKKYEKDDLESHKNDHDTNMSINFAEFDDQRNELYYNEITSNSEKKYETFAKFVNIEVFCIKCKKIFSFRNKLHKHLKENCQTMKSTKFVREKFMKCAEINDAETFIITKSIIVKFIAFIANKNYDLALRKWNYAEALMKLRSNLNVKRDYVCLDTEIEAFLTDKQFVLKRLFKAHVHLMISSLIVRDIEANVHEIKKYVNFSIYLSSRNDFIKLIEIHRELHLVKELKIDMLIENDILKSKEIIINVQQKTAIIRNYENLIIEVKIHQRESFVKRNVVSQFASLISFDSYVKIFYKIKDLLTNRDFFFESSSEVSIFIYSHVIDARTTEIIIRNKSAKSMKISRNYNDCFYASQKHQLALQTFKKNRMIEDLKAELTLEVVNRSRSSSKNSKIEIFVDEINEKFEKKIFFDVIVFEDKSEKQKFDRLINEFSKIWKNEEFINVLEEQWMRLSLKENWQNKMTAKIRSIRSKRKIARWWTTSSIVYKHRTDWNSQRLRRS